MKYLLGMIFGFFLLLLPSYAISTSQGIEWTQSLVPEDKVEMQENIVYMNISADSKLPFGCVWGTVHNGSPGYPVEIQIYKDGKPVYFAQANVKSDGTYEQYFRVKSVDLDSGKVTQIFEGDYKVLIFKSVLKTVSASSSVVT